MPQLRMAGANPDLVSLGPTLRLLAPSLLPIMTFPGSIDLHLGSDRTAVSALGRSFQSESGIGRRLHPVGKSSKPTTYSRIDRASMKERIRPVTSTKDRIPTDIPAHSSATVKTNCRGHATSFCCV